MQGSVEQEAKQIISALQAGGFRAYFVGGAVRDELLNRASSDIDITTSAKPDEICFLFPHAHRMHTEHETVLVRSGGVSIEVTTERGSSLEEDLEKRDFTINAIAKSLEGEFIDPLDGRTDLQKKQIRSVYPEDRLEEDPLRMLRAMRFASELDFTVEPALLQVISEKRGLLKSVAMERIVVEWEKLLKGLALPQAIHYLKKSVLYQYIPGLSLTISDMDKLQTFPPLSKDESRVFVWFLYLVWIGRTSESSTQGLLLSNDCKRQIKQRVSLFNWRLQNHLTDWQLYQYGFDAVIDVERSRRMLALNSVEEQDIRSSWGKLPIKTRNQLPVTGHDLIQLSNKQAGPWLKAELEWLEKKVIHREVQLDKKELLDCLRRKWLHEN
ncbi:CCA tRNA nucleotidyltransferase [Alkalicoccobacillus porphyridii]|uniref:CCA tRNA nucleotidyltransferase n=1 Tax=Alkalicoccobacillus porphyridii TaxID=2597270 RepID=UPI00163D84CD|nr:CCA tRNA nucleotidyltransferase [Alkalicoccobacillus porphyridii]